LGGGGGSAVEGVVWLVTSCSSGHLTLPQTAFVLTWLAQLGALAVCSNVHWTARVCLVQGG
jgi:hypothetical protein